MKKWDELPSSEVLSKTIEALKANNIDAVIVNSGLEAKTKALELIPAGSEVFTVTSVTLATIGLANELNESGRFHSIRKKLLSMDRNTQEREMRKVVAGPDWVVGSVHAVTQDGHVLVASQSGSQLPGYASSAGNVLWIVGAQKIVATIDEGIKRIYEYCLPLEIERSQKSYGTGSAVNKLLIINKEKLPGRVTIILVGEKLGF